MMNGWYFVQQVCMRNCAWYSLVYVILDKYDKNNEFLDNEIIIKTNEVLSEFGFSNYSTYEHQRISNNTIIYDYLSLLIIFDDISNKQKDELFNILNMYIGNSNRGDTIYITSKKLLEE